jgi:phage shock protein C
MEKKLYRSRRQRMIAGVCGGIAEYFDIDVTWVRLLLAISVFFGGIGIVLYILGIIVIPEDPVVDGNIDQDEGGRVYVNTGDTTSQTNRTALVIGVALIIIGLLSFNLASIIEHSLIKQFHTTLTLFNPLSSLSLPAHTRPAPQQL